MSDLKIFDTNNDVFISENTYNTINLKYRAYPRDTVGLGVGDTHEEAMASLAKSLRRVADSIDELLSRNTK